MSNLQNKKLLEQLVETHEERFGTRGEELLVGLTEREQIDLLELSLTTGYPLEYDRDTKETGLEYDEWFDQNEAEQDYLDNR